jgi:hypothetical protein
LRVIPDIIDNGWNYLIHLHDPIVATSRWGISILVDSDNNIRTLHAHQVLDSATYAAGDIYFGLTVLPVCPTWRSAVISLPQPQRANSLSHHPARQRRCNSRNFTAPALPPEIIPLRQPDLYILLDHSSLPTLCSNIFFFIAKTHERSALRDVSFSGRSITCGRTVAICGLVRSVRM